VAERVRGWGGFSDGPLRALPVPGQAWVIPTAVNAFGAWTDVVADTGAADAYLVGLYLENLTAGVVNGVQLRIGAAVDLAAEPVATWRAGRMPAGASIYLPAGFPIRVRARSRLAMSAAAGTVVNLNAGVAFAILAG
jgi:hypothetical protein